MTDRLDEIKRLLADLGAPLECDENGDVWSHQGSSLLAVPCADANDDRVEVGKLIAAAPELLGWAVAEIEKQANQLAQMRHANVNMAMALEQAECHLEHLRVAVAKVGKVPK